MNKIQKTCCVALLYLILGCTNNSDENAFKTSDADTIIKIYPDKDLRSIVPKMKIDTIKHDTLILNHQ